MNRREFTNNFELVLKTMRAISFFGLGPLAGNSKLFAAILIFSTTATGVYVLEARYQDLGHLSPILGKMAFGRSLFEVLFSLYCFVYYQFFAKDLKNQLVVAMRKLERKTSFPDAKKPDEFHWVHAKILFVVSYFSATYLLGFYVSITRKRFEIMVHFSTQIITVICTLQLFAYYLVSADWLRNKYDGYNSLTIVMCRKSSNFENASDKIVKHLEISNRIVKLSNELFGTSIFASNCLFIYIILHMCLSIFDEKVGDDLVLNLAVYTYPIPFVVYLIILATSYDAVENSGRQLIKTCYLSVEESKNANNREQLLLLAKYAEQWCPIFSAGGFYDINQSCLTSIFSSIIIYFVIIIQFNMVLTN